MFLFKISLLMENSVWKLIPAFSKFSFGFWASVESWGQGVEVCSGQTVAKLLWRQVYHASTIQYPPLPKDRLLPGDQHEQVDLFAHLEGQG